MCGCSEDRLVLIPFRPRLISCFTLSLKCFSSDSDNCPDVEIRLQLQFPYPPRAGPVLLTLLLFPQFLHPTKFCMVLYILFSWSGPPVCLSWSSACTSVSEDVFLMYLWREMYSTPIYSFTILFSLVWIF